MFCKRHFVQGLFLKKNLKWIQKPRKIGRQNWSRLWQPNRSHPDHPAPRLGTFQSLHVLYHLQWGFITLGSKQTRRVPLDQSKWAECQMCIWKKPRGENESKSNLQLSEYIHPRKLLEGVFPFQRVDVWGAFRFSGVYTSQVSMQQNSVSWDKDQEPSTPPVRHQNCARCTDVIVRLLRQAIQLL